MAMNHGKTVEFFILPAPGLLILEEEGIPFSLLRRVRQEKPAI